MPRLVHIPSQQSVYRWGIFPLWLLLTCSIFFRQPIPVDETRYLSVAWEMWLRGDFLVPYLNGQTYSHKPPLLFWLFQLGWGIFGINDWWPSLVGPLAALVNLLLIRKLAAKLWPENPTIALLAPWLLIATLLWTLFATSAMFDVLLTCLVLLGMLGLFELSQQSSVKSIAYISLAIGLGLLAKGPVIFLHLIPTALLLPLWSNCQKPKIFYSHLGLASLIGIILALIWAIPAGMRGGVDYANAIFWQQTADRTLGSEIHARPFFWYLLFLPLLLFPWFIWPKCWQKARQNRWLDDPQSRFCLIWLCASLTLFSLLPSKQIHYLIPLLPAFALLVARWLTSDEQPAALAVELVLPLAYGLVGVFLMALPYVPYLSKYHWTQNIALGWGLSVFIIALLMAGIVYYQKKLSVMLAASGLVAAIFVGFVCFFKYNGLAYNLRPAAEQVKHLHDQGIACVFVGNYQGQFNFIGRLSQPLSTVDADQTLPWAKQHPKGYFISVERYKPEQASYVQAHREYWLVFRTADQVDLIKAL